MRLLSLILILSLVSCADVIAPVDLQTNECSATQGCRSGFFCHKGYCARAAEQCNLDGTKDPNEECDDGNRFDDDACTEQCQIARCGDGIRRTDLDEDEYGYEECEAALLPTSQYCSGDCRVEIPPVRLATSPHFTCVGRAREVVCWGLPWDEPEHGPLLKQLPDAYGDIESIAIMKWHLNGYQDNSRSPFLMVQLDPGITVFSPWITDPSILPNGEDDLADLFFWQSAFRIVTFRARRAIASDHRGRFWYGTAEDRAYCWINEDRSLVCNRKGDCRAAPDPQLDGSNYHGTDLSRLGPMADIALAQATTCAARRNGEVLCWGDLSGYGRPDRSLCASSRGRPLGEHSSERQVQDLEDIVAVSAGDYAFLALARDGVVYEWGWDWRLEELIQRPEFYEFDEPVTRITNAVQTRCVLLESGRVGCWGLHNGSPDGPSGRVHWLNLPPVKELSDGWSSHHLCALTVEDEVYCWGRNEHNQLGDGSYEDQLEPVHIVDVPPPVSR